MATSSRRSPFTRRLWPYAGRLACSGVIFARREDRNSRMSLLASMFSTLRASIEMREALAVPLSTGTPSIRPLVVP